MPKGRSGAAGPDGLAGLSAVNGAGETAAQLVNKAKAALGIIFNRRYRFIHFEDGLLRGRQAAV